MRLMEKVGRPSTVSRRARLVEITVAERKPD